MNVVVCHLMMHCNVIAGVTISRGSFVYSQSRVKVSASLPNRGILVFNICLISISNSVSDGATIKSVLNMERSY